MELRNYQISAVNAIYHYLASRDDGCLVILPAGSGKTLVLAQICKDAVTRWNGRVIVVAHRKELLEQNANAIRRLAPELDVGIYSAGLGKRQHDKPVVVAGIQSVFSRGCELGRFDLCLIDEVHRLPPDGDGMYRTFLADLKAVNPDVRIVGLTATPLRMGTGNLYGPGEIFPDVCFEVGIRPLMAQGFLCKLTSKTGNEASVADTSQVHTRGGEFVEGELEACMSDAAVVAAAVAETVKYADQSSRKKCLIFACGIMHAEMISREFSSSHGIECPAVHSKLPDELRDERIERFRNGEVRFTVNPNLLTEGFDDPSIDMIALMRATQSPGLFVQMVGRGMRIHPSKETCCVLDFGENIQRHGPVDKIKPHKSTSSGSDAAPVKTCPECAELVPAAVLQCPACGYEFPSPDVARHGPKADDLPVLSEPKAPPMWLKVDMATYHVHVKKNAPEGAPRTMRVDYEIGFNHFVSEWICVEHAPGTYPFSKAWSWWAARCTLHPMPTNADQAVAIARSGALWTASEILVESDKPSSGKDSWPRIKDYKLVKEEAIPADFRPSQEDQLPF